MNIPLNEKKIEKIQSVNESDLSTTKFFQLCLSAFQRALCMYIKWLIDMHYYFNRMYFDNICFSDQRMPMNFHIWFFKTYSYNLSWVSLDNISLRIVTINHVFTRNEKIKVSFRNDEDLLSSLIKMIICSLGWDICFRNKMTKLDHQQIKQI